MHVMTGDGKDYSRKQEQGRASNEQGGGRDGLGVEQKEEEGVRINDPP